MPSWKVEKVTPELVKRLRALWLSGMTTVEMAREVGRTKNAVVGIAHRNKFPPRPSPIIRGARHPAPAEIPMPRAPAPPPPAVAAEPSRPKAPPAPKPRTAPPPDGPAKAPEAGGPVANSPGGLMVPVAAVTLPPVVSRPAFVPRPKPMPEPELENDEPGQEAPTRLYVASPARGCHWPIGHPGEPDFRFCGAKRDPTCRAPYCAEHRRVAFSRPGERREDAA